MKKLLITLIALAMLGCGSSGGSSGAVFAPPTSAQPNAPASAQGLTFTLKPIGKDQVIPFNNLLRMEVENTDSVKHEFGGVKGRFLSSLPAQSIINYQMMLDGKRELDVGAADMTRPITMPTPKELLPGQKTFVYLLALPHSLHVGETMEFIIDEVIVDGKPEAKTLKPGEVTINRGGLNKPLYVDIPQFIPFSQSTQNVVVWKEKLIPSTTREQELYDYEIRFRSGFRNQHTSLTMKGNALLQVKNKSETLWRTVDELSIHGHAVGVHYKFAFFGEALDEEKDVQVVFNIQCKSGESFTMSRTTIGSDTGWLNFPTRHGPTFTCR